MSSKVRNPLEPFMSTVMVVTGLVAAMVGISVVATIFGSGSILGWGSPNACVEMLNGTMRTSSDPVRVLDLPPGSSVYPSVVRLCIEHPSVGQRIGATLTQLPSQLVFFGFLLLVNRILNGARATGLYTTELVRRLRFLGWYLALGALAASIIEALALGSVLASQTPDREDWLSGFREWDPSWAMIISGLALITISRIMRIGAAMRDDLAGTV